jgi:23S rRNA pseudouridine1911/1915/1917 synthase
MKPFEPGLLHRLDKGTSGVVVIARTAAAFTVLRLQFEAGEAQKEYHAVCECSAGRRLEETVEIQSSFAPAGPGRHKVRVVIPGEKNRKLLRKASRALYITQVKIEQVLGAQALVLAVIRKGFRHQVRAHLAFAGLPIVGDTLYGAPAPDVAEQRMYLHASSILLTHPVTGKLLCVTSPLPESFYAIFRR